MPKLIKNWDELKECKSDTHILEIEDGCGWITENTTGYIEYLSTHTFYGGTHEESTKTLQECGFDMEIDNWDKESVSE